MPSGRPAGRQAATAELGCRQDFHPSLHGTGYSPGHRGRFDRAFAATLGRAAAAGGISSALNRVDPK